MGVRGAFLLSFGCYLFHRYRLFLFHDSHYDFVLSRGGFRLHCLRLRRGLGERLLRRVGAVVPGEAGPDQLQVDVDLSETDPPQPDPVLALLHLRLELARRGIGLVVVPGLVHSDEMALSAAARVIASDLQYVQSLALAQAATVDRD